MCVYALSSLPHLFVFKDKVKDNMIVDFSYYFTQRRLFFKT